MMYIFVLLSKKINMMKQVFTIVVNLSNTGVVFVVKEDLEKQLNEEGTLKRR